MAANYSGPGTATDPTDLVKKILAWLIVQGWTQDMSQVDGSGWRVHAHKGGVYVNMRSIMNESTVWAGGMTAAGYGIAMYTGSGFNGASAWNAQAGGPIGSGAAYTVGAGINLTSGAITASHFFDDGSDNITIVVERTGGVFGHLGWGSAPELGAGTARRYFFGSISCFYNTYSGAAPGTTQTSYCPGACNDGLGEPAYYVKLDVDAFTGKWVSGGTATSSFQGYTGKVAPSGIPGSGIPAGIQNKSVQIDRSVSALNSQPNFIPVDIYALRDAGGYSHIITLPGIFATIATANGYAFGTVYPIGAANYMLFHNFAVLKGS